MNFVAPKTPRENPLPTNVVSNRRSTAACLAAWIIGGFFALSSAAQAQQNIVIGAAEDFAVLGASTVTNTGPMVVTGNVGVSAGVAITGFPPGLVTGTIHAGDAVAAQARTDATTAFNQNI